MGLHFGNLYKIRRVVYFRISPHELKPFAGMISEGFPNLLRRIDGCIYRILPQFAGMYLCLAWADEAYARSIRKDPKLYENDS